MSGVFVLPVNAILKTVLTSPTCASYLSGFALNSLTSLAYPNFPDKNFI